MYSVPVFTLEILWNLWTLTRNVIVYLLLVFLSNDLIKLKYIISFTHRQDFEGQHISPTFRQSLTGGHMLL